MLKWMSRTRSPRTTHVNLCYAQPVSPTHMYICAALHCKTSGYHGCRQTGGREVYFGVED